MTRQGKIPLPDKVQAIKDITVTTNKKQLRSFIGGAYLIRYVETQIRYINSFNSNDFYTGYLELGCSTLERLWTYEKINF